MDENNIIPDCQIGFSKGCRTSDHVLVLKAFIDLYKKKHKHIYACSIDLSSAFDNVWHSGLIYKLNQSGVSSKIVKLLYTMYNKLECCVKQGVDVSKNFKLNKGTKHGCSMSLALFKQYISDLAK